VKNITMLVLVALVLVAGAVRVSAEGPFPPPQCPPTGCPTVR